MDSLVVEFVEKDLVNVDLEESKSVLVDLIEQEIISTEFVEKEVVRTELITKNIFDINFQTIDIFPRKEVGIETFITSASNNQVLIYQNGYWINTDIQTLVQLFLITDETPIGDVDGINDEFELQHTPVVESVIVSLNGLNQALGIGRDYTLLGKIITFAKAPKVGNKVTVDYVKI